MAQRNGSQANVRWGTNNRFTGIQNLLRRISYNLGNTPSKTEVKIVSCIPIDVTDLQYKIIALEKQLENERRRRPRSQPQSKSPQRPRSPPPRVPTAECEAANKCGHSPTNSFSPVNSNTSMKSWNEQCATYSDKKQFNPVIINRVEDSIIPDRARTLSETSFLVRKKKHKTPDLSLYFQDYAQYNIKSPSKHGIQEDQNIFGRVISDRDRTRLVYYAQTAGSPFTNYKKANDTRKETSDQAMDREYLSSLLERQHQVKMYMDDDKLGSQGSVPVCRDVPRCSGTSDDMCSCCHGNFLDVDCKIRKRPFYDPNLDHGNIYCDSSLYDVRPVKQPKPFKCQKPCKNSALGKKRVPELDCTFLPEYYRFKPEYFLNYSMAHSSCDKKPIQKRRERRANPVFLPNDSSATDGLVEFSHVYPKRLLPKQKLRCDTNERVSTNAECNTRSDNTEFCIRPSKPIQTFPVTKLITTSNNLSKSLSESVEYTQPIDNAKYSIGQMKALQTSLSKLRSTHNGINVRLKNAACLAHPVNEMECQTDSLNNAQSDCSSPPDKTESTLKQIKTILETVLIEVKTNSVARTVISEKETKDATVQNEHGPTSECERLLNSITYSPYSLYNPYLPSCSYALPSYCSSMMRQTLTIPRHEMPTTDLTNFPEMVHQQTVAAHSCFPDRNAMQPKQTLTCGTNTLHDPPKRRNTETEDLIKEIYKSIKLDVDYPVKVTSHNAINESKTIDVCKALPEGKTMLGRDEIVFRGDVGTSRAARLEISSSHCSLAKPHRRGSLHQQPKHSTSAQRRQGISKGTNKDSIGSDSDSASDVDILQPSASPVKAPTKTAKKGFFGKVMSSVVKRMHKKEEQQPLRSDKRTAAATQDSESSDFETPITPRERPVKHVSYAPAAPQTWREGQSTRPMPSTSKTRRLGHSQHRRPERPTHQTQRMPRYVPPRPRSVLRPHAGSSQIRRTLYRPQPPNRPRTPPEYMKRVPHNEYDWRTTPTKSVHRMTPISTNEYKPRIPTKSPGIKITNKTWMRKPVYHLGFACGPEKEKIMMQY